MKDRWNGENGHKVLIPLFRSFIFTSKELSMSTRANVLGFNPFIQVFYFYVELDLRDTEAFKERLF